MHSRLVAALLTVLLTGVMVSAQDSKISESSLPLSVSDIKHGLKAGVTNTRMAALVKQYGVDFELTEAVRKELSADGANCDLLLDISREWRTKKANADSPAVAYGNETDDSAVAKAEVKLNTGRVRDAVIEAQDILKTDPNNLRAHKLLGRIYLHSLSDMPATGSEKLLKLTIEQYEEILKIDPSDSDSRIVLDLLRRKTAPDRAVGSKTTR